jgi:hypothetical protein
MFKTELVNPNLGNFIESFREIGYSFEVAVADLIDNSITAQAGLISIHAVTQPSPIFCLVDDGRGMTEKELTEAMRLASRNPNESRSKEDLGRFGLGLKTASFSQCRKLTVISKKNGRLSARQWDLDYISQKNKWLLILPKDFSKLPLVQELKAMDSGTLICWEKIDRLPADDFPAAIDRLRKHLSLVFHRFLEGADEIPSIKIRANNNLIVPFNPFNLHHPATQQTAAEKLKLNCESILVQPYILPHHSKLSQQDYELHATEEGYIKSQGFYLYRQNRILIHGTWWGLHKSVDAHKLVRIKIDIPNNMDLLWSIDVKKSTARPPESIKNDLRRIIAQITEMGSRPYTGRGRRIEDKSVVQFWEILPVNGDFRFAVNLDHPILKDLLQDLSEQAAEKLAFYMKGLQAYLPLEAIQSRLQKAPHLIKQQSALTEDDKTELAEKLRASGLSQEKLEDLLKTEIFFNRKDLLDNENE